MIETMKWVPDAAELAGAPHVLLILDQLPKVLGGGERIVLRLAALLPAYGYRVSILTFDAHPETSALSSSTCSIYLLRLKRTYDWSALRAAAALARFLRQQDVKIVQTFFESSDLWAGMVTKLFSGAKLVWSRRDMGILRRHKHEIAYRWMARMPDAVFAVSEGVRQHCIAKDGIDPKRVRTIYNGLDPSRWLTAPRRPRDVQRIVITTVGNIRWVKGHDVLVRAAAVIVRTCPNAYFSIAGGILEPAYFDELQSLAQKMGISDHITYCGAVTDLPGHLSLADIFVLPSRSEGFSNAIIEAMAASLPVVATDVGGNPEAVENGASGFIVPKDDPDALAVAITRLIRDPELGQKMGRRGKAIADSKFTEQVMMKSVTAVFAELLS